MHSTAFQTCYDTTKNRKKLHLWDQSTKLHIQIKIDNNNTVMQALLKIWNILLHRTSEKNTETVFPTLDSDNLIGTASKEDFSELSLWLLWRYTCTRSSLVQRCGRNMSLLKSDHTWPSMSRLTRPDFWQRESQKSFDKPFSHQYLGIDGKLPHQQYYL